jgi:hypothetical protein
VRTTVQVHWRDTLLHFLSHSDEDAAYERFFDRNLPRLVSLLPQELSETNWVDIGAGPGTKTRYLLSQLCHHVQAIHLTTVDPDPGWSSYLSSDAFTIPWKCARYEYILGSIDSHYGNGSSAKHPHLVTAFQVLYDQPLVDQFARLIADNTQALFILTAECSSSALSCLRKEVQEKAGITCAQSHLPTLARRVSLWGRHSELVRIPGQSLHLTDTCIGSVSSPGWFLPFLLGMSDEEFGRLDKKIQAKCWDVVLNRFVVSRSNIWSLPIPDQALIVHPIGKTPS